MLSVIAFAILIEPFGVVPAVVSAVLISRFAEEERNILGSLLFGAIMSVVVILIFNVAPGMTFHIVTWPF